MPGSGGMACLCVTAELAVAAINHSENSLKSTLLSVLDLCRLEVGKTGDYWRGSHTTARPDNHEQDGRLDLPQLSSPDVDAGTSSFAAN